MENGLICHKMINLYQEEGIIVEPAGALSICGLEKLNESGKINSKNDKINGKNDKINGKKKNIVCIVSGGNNDLMRYPEIMEKNLIYLNRKHYYIIQFNQKPQELKKFINNILEYTDGDLNYEGLIDKSLNKNFDKMDNYGDITRFDYLKKTNSNYGSVLVGIETKYNDIIEKNDKKWF